MTLEHEAPRVTRWQDDSAHGLGGGSVGLTDATEVAPPLYGRPHHVKGRARTGFRDRLREPARVLHEEPARLRERRRSLLQHDHVPFPLANGALGITLVPVILEAEPADRTV